MIAADSSLYAKLGRYVSIFASSKDGVPPRMNIDMANALNTEPSNDFSNGLFSNESESSRDFVARRMSLLKTVDAADGEIGSSG